MLPGDDNEVSLRLFVAELDIELNFYDICISFGDRAALQIPWDIFSFLGLRAGVGQE